MIESVEKRDGTLSRFEKEKITEAIFEAAKSVGGHDRQEAQRLADLIEEELDRKYKVPNVEEVQDLVERVLIKEGHAKTAKAYILYREAHAHIRSMTGSFIEVKDSVNDYLKNLDWRVKENSNEDYSYSGLMFYISSKVVANYTLNQIYTPQINEAHRNGDMHIHDLGTGLVAYCCGWSLNKLLMNGFGGPLKKVTSKPPKHMGTAVHQMVNFIGTLQLEHSGAQAFSSVDTLLAPFVKKDKMTYKEVKQEIQTFVFSLNVPSRWGCQTPFSNITMDWVVPEDMKKVPAMLGGKPQEFTYADCQEEMDMINKAFLEIILEGDAHGRPFFFPIPTYNITKDFDWDSENAKLLFEMASKYGTPYFQNFVNSDLDPSDVRSMCCRLQLDLNKLKNRMGGLFGAGDQTGSIGVVTINLPRIGYTANSEEEFFEKLGHFMGVARDSLEIKRMMIDKHLKGGLMPFTKEFIGSYDNHFSTIGINGMHEALQNFLGKGIETKEGRDFAIKTLNFMRDKLTEYQEETKNLYNLEATPAEGCSFRFAKTDKQLYPEIITAGPVEKPYYTNSTHLPVDFSQDIFEALEHQDGLQTLYTGGTVLHGFLGEKVDDWKTTKELVKKISHGYKLPYFTITPTYSICPEHGYIKGEHFTCPCGTSESKQEATKVEVAK